jgi:tetratricopeptide (TPR) repeat protein
VLLRASQGDPRRARGLTFAAATAGALEQLDIASLVRGDQLAGTKALALARATELEATPLAIVMLGGSDRIDDAEALFRERIDALVESPAGTASATALMHLLVHAGRPNDAIRVAQEYRAALRGGRTPGVEEEINLRIAFAHATLLAAEPLSALYACSEAFELLGESTTRHLQEPQLIRFQALALRDAGFVTDARKAALRGLQLEDLPAVRRAQLLSVVASCLMVQGELEAASAEYDQAASVLAATDWRQELAITHASRASVLLARRRDEEALAAAREALALAEGDDDSDITAPLAIAAEAATRLRLPDATALAERALAAVDRRLERSRRAPGWEMDALNLKAHVLATAGDCDALRAIVDGGVRSWQLPSSLAEAYARQGRWSEARQSLEQAWGWISTSFDPALDARSISTLRLGSEIQEWTAEVAFRDPEAAGGLLGAAERQSSLVAGLLAWPPERREEAVALLREPGGLPELIPDGTLVVAAAQGRDTTAFVAASRRRAVQLLAVDSAELERTRDEWREATRRSRPRGRPLESRAWNILNQRLGAALKPLLGGIEAVLFTGAAAVGLPLHLVAIGDVELVRRLPCSSAASLLQVAGLQARRVVPAARTLRAGIATTPSVLDTPAARAAFADGAKKVRAVLARHTSEITVAVGADATPDAVRQILQTVDLGVLSCHGLADPGSGSHALLLAAEGRLPPRLFAPTPAEGRRYLLAWDAIEGPTPAVVVSAACSSSSATTVQGGERVALDRALLAAGTRLFAGPLWDVAIDDSHALAAALIERAFPTGDWTGAWHGVARDYSADVPQASWGAFVIVGDGRAAP